MKTTKKTGLLIFELLLLALVLFFVVKAFGYNARARLVPLLIGIPTLLLLLFQIGLDHVPAMKGLAPATMKPGLSKSEAKAKTTEAHFMPEGELVRREMMALAWVIGLGLGLTLFGYFVVLPAFLVVMLRFVSGLSWTSTFVSTGVSMLILYFAFVWFLRVELYPGIIPIFG